MHPDHMGLAHWLTERWNCRLWISATDFNAARLASTATTGFGGGSAALFMQSHGLSDPDSPEKRQSYALLLQTEYLLLCGIRGPIPERYVRHREELGRELEELGISAEPERLWNNLRKVAAGAGLVESTLARIVDLGFDPAPTTVLERHAVKP
jgi:hypothetical protein